MLIAVVFLLLFYFQFNPAEIAGGEQVVISITEPRLFFFINTYTRAHAHTHTQTHTTLKK